MKNPNISSHKKHQFDLDYQTDQLVIMLRSHGFMVTVDQSPGHPEYGRKIHLITSISKYNGIGDVFEISSSRTEILLIDMSAITPKELWLIDSSVLINVVPACWYHKHYIDQKDRLFVHQTRFGYEFKVEIHTISNAIAMVSENFVNIIDAINFATNHDCKKLIVNDVSTDQTHKLDLTDNSSIITWVMKYS